MPACCLYLLGMIAIMGAMPEEVSGLVAAMQNVHATEAGMRTYYKGQLFGHDAVVVFSRWGKVAAATTALHLLHQYPVQQLIFTGVAGAVQPQLAIGDVVVGHKLYQHDMDARPLMQQFEIPLLGKTFFETDTRHRQQVYNATQNLLGQNKLVQQIGSNQLLQYGIQQPTVHIGDIASGDKFFNTTQHKNQLLQHLPHVLCVEMEGAAVAQVCYEYGVPFSIVRIISDVADDNSHIDFPAFVKSVASHYSVAIVEELLK